MTRIDINADMGESFGAWTMGNDEALLDIVTSANIACGFHAGDYDVMAKTMRLATQRSVVIGAHPGFPDLQGFGRRTMDLSLGSIANLVRYQLGAAIIMAEAAGSKISHFKLHGALSHMAVADSDIAKTCFEAVKAIDPNMTIFVLAATPMQAAAERAGCRWAGEIFADRAYLDDGRLMSRKLPGAVIHDPTIAARRIREMVSESAIITESGKRITTKIDTVCVHGDTPEAINIARAVKAGLIEDGIEIVSLANP